MKNDVHHSDITYALTGEVKNFDYLVIITFVSGTHILGRKRTFCP